MSILDFPRIYFSGSCLLHEPTGNNNAKGNIDLTRNVIYDENWDPVNPKIEPTDFYNYFTSIGEKYDSNGKPLKEGIFNQAAGRNYEGNNRVLWQAMVTGCQLNHDELITNDSLVGESVNLWGDYNEYLQTTFNQPKVAKLDQTSINTRQIFGGQFTVGDRLKNCSLPHHINGYIGNAQHSRWYKTKHYPDLQPHWNNSEIGNAAVYQFVISKEELIELSTTSNSTCLNQFEKILEQGNGEKGIVVQFSLFNASSPITPNTPAFYSIYGTIGIWDSSTEMATYPAGRILRPVTKETNYKHCRSLGTISVKMYRTHVSINAIIGFPFYNRSNCPVNGPLHNPGNVKMEDKLYLFSEGLDKPIACLNRFSFTEKIFLDKSGIIDLDYSNQFSTEEWTNIETRNLYFATKNEDETWNLLFQEQALIIASDQVNVYLDIPSEKNNLYFDQKIEIRSFLRGKPSSVKNIQIKQQHNPSSHPFKHPEFSLKNIEKASILTAPLNTNEFTSDLVFSTDNQGIKTIKLRGNSSGALRLFFIKTEEDAKCFNNLQTMNDFEAYNLNNLTAIYPNHNFINIVVLPNDWKLFNLETKVINFKLMYKEVLCFYELLFPFMNREVFSLHNKAKTETYARLSWQMCDPNHKSKSYYMPPTRDLSYPKAMLFRKFLTHVSKVGFIPKDKPK